MCRPGYQRRTSTTWKSKLHCTDVSSSEPLPAISSPLWRCVCGAHLWVGVGVLRVVLHCVPVMPRWCFERCPFHRRLISEMQLSSVSSPDSEYTHHHSDTRLAPLSCTHKQTHDSTLPNPRTVTRCGLRNRCGTAPPTFATQTSQDSTSGCARTPLSDRALLTIRSPRRSLAQQNHPFDYKQCTTHSLTHSLTPLERCQLPVFPGTRLLAETHQKGQQGASVAAAVNNASREQRRAELEQWIKGVCEVVGTQEPYFSLVAGKYSLLLSCLLGGCGVCC